MQESCGSKKLIHALTLIGLGGTGKTQLVLHYINQHKRRYDTILCLDVRTEATTMSSFERCCGALSIAVERRQSTDGLLQDAPAVQKLLKWLIAREQGQKWLVVLDNADVLDHLPQIIPENALAGSVIITSHDGSATKLLHGSKCTRIDKMEMNEGKALLALSMKLSVSPPSLAMTSRLEKLVNRLDGIALALDLASARIRDDIDPEIDADDTVSEGAAIDAIDQYFTDLEEQEKSILSDRGHNPANGYQETIGSVWKTVLTSVERSEQRDTETPGYTMHLLKFAVILGPTVMHREVFRAASQSLEAALTGFKIDVPLWFKDLLHVSGDGTWDSFVYRRCIKRLERFHLIHPASQDVHTTRRTTLDTNPVTVTWPGFAIHSLIRRCTSVDEVQVDYQVCRAALVDACCRTWDKYYGGIDFRYALLDYIRHVGCVGRHLDLYTPNGMADVCTLIGTALLSIGEIESAELTLEKAWFETAIVSGMASPATRDVGLELYKLYHTRQIGLKAPEENLQEREVYREKANQIERSVVGARGSGGAIRLFAVSWDAMMVPVQLWEWTVQLNRLALRFTQEVEPIFMKRAFQDKYDTLAGHISELLKVLELTQRARGQHDGIVRTLRSGLIQIYGTFGKFDSAKPHLEGLLAQEKQSYGRLDHRTLQSMERLSFCHMRLHAPDAATEMMREVCKLSRTALGRDDPRTHLRERHLERLHNRKSTATLTEFENGVRHMEECLAMMEWFRMSDFNEMRRGKSRHSD